MQAIAFLIGKFRAIALLIDLLTKAIAFLIGNFKAIVWFKIHHACRTVICPYRRKHRYQSVQIEQVVRRLTQHICQILR